MAIYLPPPLPSLCNCRSLHARWRPPSPPPPPPPPSQTPSSALSTPSPPPLPLTYSSSPSQPSSPSPPPNLRPPSLVSPPCLLTTPPPQTPTSGAKSCGSRYSDPPLRLSLPPLQARPPRRRPQSLRLLLLLPPLRIPLPLQLRRLPPQMPRRRWPGPRSPLRPPRRPPRLILRRLRRLPRTAREAHRLLAAGPGVLRLHWRDHRIMVLELLSPVKLERQTATWSMHVDASVKPQFQEIHVPSGLDLSKNAEYASQAALWGIEGLEELGEMYPLGGSGDRLGLVDPDTGECLPAAMLPYCGRTLLEGLIRDLQAREFLYYKLYGKQCITPVAIMTSSAKKNHQRIMTLCERVQWFGRGRMSFQLFEQPVVPCIGADDGQWFISKPLTPICKPGGHGVIWKLAYDKGIFRWFYGYGRRAATVRQVSNVVAATDLTLLALSGIGLHHGKKIGFASCERKVGATEGINVLIEKKIDGHWAYGITCIEYTEFEKFFRTDGRISPSRLHADFPANTNILYVDLASAERVGSPHTASCLPGMVLNLKKPIVYVDSLGMLNSISGGRLECTMQNIADQFLNTYPSRRYKDVEGALDTFVVYNERRKVTSSAKKKRRQMNKSLHQTPDGSLLDIIRNASDLLSRCDIIIPKVEENNKHVNSGLPFLILLHPALGPLWEISQQKFHGGSIAEGSELQIEVAEFLWRNVQLDGSLIVVAENVMGSTKIHRNEPILQYGLRCGRCKLKNIKVLNKGIDWNSPENVYWRHKVERIETCKIILQGNAEFEATDVVLKGNHIFEVPNGHRLRVTSGNPGFSAKLEPIKEEMMDKGSWFWKYILKGTHVHLEMVEL